MDQDRLSKRATTRIWIPVGAVLFLIALAVSALVVPQLRLLHLLQGLIYVAVMVLSSRNSPWGFGAGVTIALVWNSLNLFVTHLMQAGAVAWWRFMHTGQVQRLDTMMVLVGGIGHFILIIAGLSACSQLSVRKKWWKFAGGGALTIAYFALIVAVARPR